MNFKTKGLVISPYALDTDLMAAVRRSQQSHLRIYIPHVTAVVLGWGSKPGVELHLDACIQDRIPVLRRRGGGCAVVIDPGNVILSAALPQGGISGSRKYFSRFSDWIIEGLRKVGLSEVRPDGISDLVIGDRKIAGASLYRSADVLYYSASLLVDPDINLIERYLKHPPREPEYRRGRPHRDFICGLKSLVSSWDAQMLAQELRGALGIGDLLASIDDTAIPG